MVAQTGQPFIGDQAGHNANILTVKKDFVQAAVLPEPLTCHGSGYKAGLVVVMRLQNMTVQVTRVKVAMQGSKSLAPIMSLAANHLFARSGGAAGVGGNYAGAAGLGGAVVIIKDGTEVVYTGTSGSHTA